MHSPEAAPTREIRGKSGGKLPREQETGPASLLGPDWLECMTHQILRKPPKLIVSAFGLWSPLSFSFQDRKTGVLARKNRNQDRAICVYFSLTSQVVTNNWMRVTPEREQKEKKAQGHNLCALEDFLIA